MDIPRTHLVGDELDSIARALCAKFPATEATYVRRIVEDAYRDIARHARIAAHLITLTVHRAREALASATTVPYQA